MALDYGIILVSSVPSESVFSIAGLQIAQKRNRLAPKTRGELCVYGVGGSSRTAKAMMVMKIQTTATSGRIVGLAGVGQMMFK